MKKYAIIEVIESIKMNAGETLSPDNLIREELEQTAMNESLKDDFSDGIYDTLEECREALKGFKSTGRVDMVKVGKHRYWECAITTYQLTEVEVEEDGEILDWGDVWEITPFKIEIDEDGKVSEFWG